MARAANVDRDALLGATGDKCIATRAMYGTGLITGMDFSFHDINSLVWRAYGDLRHTSAETTIIVRWQATKGWLAKSFEPRNVIVF